MDNVLIYFKLSVAYCIESSHIVHALYALTMLAIILIPLNFLVDVSDETTQHNTTQDETRQDKTCMSMHENIYI